MDATCCSADIAFPQDFQLLNDARKPLEHMVNGYAKSLKGLLLALAEMWMAWFSWKQSEKFQMVAE